MRASTTALIAVMAASAEACIHFWGGSTRGLINLNQSGWSQNSVFEDNGDRVCSGGSVRDGRFWANCREGFALSFTTDGRHVWYHAHGTDFEWDQSVSENRYCCLGPCDDRGPKLYCTDYDWDTWMYC